MIPNGALHDLSVLEDSVVLCEVEECGTQDCEVEDLVTGSTHIEFSWWASLRTPDHVDYRTLDINVASYPVDHSTVRCDVWIHEGEHKEHARCWQAQDYVHDAAHWPKLWLVKLRNECHNEAGKACNCQDRNVDVLGN